MHFPTYYSYLAECLGTAFFIFVILATKGNIYAISLAFFVILFSVSKISGGHVNPIVTIVMILKSELPKTEFVPYLVSQIAGGLIGLELFKFI